jgi:multidrug efflux system outer membrane protein
MIRAMAVLTLCAGLAAGCALEPAYHRPAPPVPVAWPSGPAYGAPADLALADWRQVFPDPKLRNVIEQALANSRDLRVAIAQIQASRAQYRVQRAALLPTVDASVAANTGRSYTGLPPALGSQYANATTYSASVSTTAYELDLFGRVRSLTKAALQTYLATEEARRSTQISLVAEVATDYLTFASDASLLDVSKATVISAGANFDLARRRLAGGIDSQLDVSNAQTIVEQASDDVARYTTQVAQDKNALDLVVGAVVDPQNLPSGVDDPAARLGEPPGALDSRILLQRPDVMEAERKLRSANASIGAARAAFFPSISLTGSGGSESASVSSLFSGAAAVWSFAPTISVPIFAGGANRANLAYAKAEDRIDVAQYEKAIQTAFREVADALAQRGTIAERLRAQRALVAASAQSLRLAQALYARGSDSYLDVLTAQRTYYSAQQSLISVQLIQAANVVTLYKVLGGAITDRASGA